MARIRNIKPGAFLDADLCDLSPLHRWLFAGLWCQADREGRLWDKPRELKVKVLPYDDCNIDALLDDLAVAGFIIRYEVQGVRYIQVCKFVEHQRFHKDEKPLGLPAPTEPVAANTNSAPPQHGADTVSAALVSESGSLNLEAGKLSSNNDEPSRSAPDLVQNPPSPQEQPDQEAVAKVMSHYREAMKAQGIDARDTRKRRKLIRARLNDGHPVEELLDAINGLTWSDFHLKGGYTDLEYAIRDAGQIDQMKARLREATKAREARLRL